MTNRAPQQRRGLGRGLGSLIPTAPVAEDESQRGDEHAPHGSATSPGHPGSGTAGTTVLDRSADWIGRVPDPVGADGAPTPTPSPADMPAPSPAPTPAAGSMGSASGSGVGPQHPAAPEGAQGGADTGLRPVEGAHFAELAVSSISPNPRQPRQVFDEEAMAELVHSISEVGLLQPVVVRAVAEDRYELIMGERRWRATQEAGLATIPAIVRDTGDDQLLRDALLENLHRAQLNPLEEAAAYQQLLDDFGCTHEELAARIGRSRPQISNTLRLLKLSPPVQRRVAAGVLSAGHARALLGVPEETDQDRLAGRVVAEGISVRGLEELVAVGETGADAPARARRPKPTAPAVADLAGRLSDLYDTRVKVDLGRSKGRITIEFASLPDLERIVAAMDPTYERRHAEE